MSEMSGKVSGEGQERARRSRGRVILSSKKGETSVDRLVRIEALKRAIEEGSYHIEADLLADCLIRKMLGER